MRIVARTLLVLCSGTSAVQTLGPSFAGSRELYITCGVPEVDASLIASGSDGGGSCHSKVVACITNITVCRLQQQ